MSVTPQAPDAPDYDAATRDVYVPQQQTAPGQSPPPWTPQGPQQIAAQPPAKRPTRWPFIVMGVAVAFTLIVLTVHAANPGGTGVLPTPPHVTGSGNSGYQAPAYPPSYSAPSYTAPTYTAPTYTAPSDTVAPDPAPATNSFSDGTYEVGSSAGDIPAGRYKTTGANAGAAIQYCAVVREKTDGSIIDLDNSSGGPMVVTIKGSDGQVEFQGDCTWTKQ
jgi:hypothetical protein